MADWRVQKLCRKEPNRLMGYYVGRASSAESYTSYGLLAASYMVRLDKAKKVISGTGPQSCLYLRRG